MFSEEFKAEARQWRRLPRQFFAFVVVLYTARYVIDYVWSFLRCVIPDAM